MKKIRFEKYKPTDFNNFFKLVQDDEVMKYISGKGLNEEQANHKFTSILEKGSVNENLGFFKVYDENDTLLGDCKLVYNKHIENSLEIGYLLKKEFWRKGFGSMICEHLLVESKEKFPDLQVMAVIDPDNVASRKLLEKFNFESYWKGIENDLPTEKLLLKEK
ncbi:MULTISPECIES: GNAT family N-acetyltransferase [Empedobacter]|uniref:GNAT family N-acetyltransferase n=1 Tax=Empedobacter TaxID=59734 RepID=UPI001C8E35CC|nr:MULTISPECIES: GNAT family N-acetyltransferase [Empedobacter]MBY0067733.1 GNAT family N-acetyltransferase [Empedobacter falsenii]MDM1138068.1 GNAT family N-acetyltransferase [Empedobacter sp. R132-2]